MKNPRIFLSILIVTLAACGGGNGSEEGVVIEGQVTQGSSVNHSSREKHGESEPLENIKVCALGRCSTTDGQGMYGFVAPSEFTHGDVLFSVNGHGILAETVVQLPEGKNLFVHLESDSASEVHLHHLSVDGLRYEPQELEVGHSHD